MTGRAQLRRAIRASGLSRAAFAKTVLLRSPRTLRRWLKGEYEIPPTVRNFLAIYDPSQRRTG
jgi:transcriptional regulator with XRE-family HTH domain